ncbi:MAG: sugar-binding transcriptional regulator [Anaerolineae bacterium]|jgi:DNA-binding transcriptional regulator LsrR (DeoR family)
MIKSPEKHRLLYKLSVAYYTDGLTQKQIAARFGVSRSTISRMLKEARQEGVVNITVVPPGGGTAELERELERVWRLEEAIVVRVTDPDDQRTLTRELAPAAVECILRYVAGSRVVGITWGRTMSAVARALPTRSWPDLKLVQVDGGLGPVDVLEHSSELVRRIAQKLGAQLVPLEAPGVVSTRAAAQALKSDRQISRAIAMAARADVCIVGLGVPTPDSVLLRDGTIITQTDLERIEASGAVGDLILRHIDAQGNPVDLEVNERIIGLTLEQMRSIPRVIGIAGGTAKFAVILAALRGDWLDVLATDHVTAQALIDVRESEWRGPPIQSHSGGLRP